MERQLRFLVQSHELKTVVLIAHQECGYYKQIRLREKTLEGQQWSDLRRAGERIRTYGAGVAVRGFFARRAGEKVVFEEQRV